MQSVDVNADLGEGYPSDQDILPWITSANIACGGHAGGGRLLRETMHAAATHQVTVGAHISYPDLDNFGRTSRPDIPHHKLTQSLRTQLADALAAAHSAGVSLRHIKPHGALYNDAAQNPALADLLCNLAYDLTDTPLPLMGLPNSVLHTHAEDAKVPFIAEGFADRAYQPNGHLHPRSEPNAVHNETATIVNQALALATGAPFPTYTGEPLTLTVASICVHGDTPEALTHAIAIHRALTDAGIPLTPATPQ